MKWELNNFQLIMRIQMTSSFISFKILKIFKIKNAQIKFKKLWLIKKFSKEDTKKLKLYGL